MIKGKQLFIPLMTLAGGLFLGWLFFSTDEVVATEHDHEQEVRVWTCSMHPQVRSSSPGQCPICAMDLVPVSEVDSDSDVVQLSASDIRLASIATQRVGQGSQRKTLTLTGKVQEDESKVFSQTSHIPGRIEKLMVNYTGEFVSKGKTIALIYSPELVTAQEELFEAYSLREKQPALYKAAREKLKNLKLSEERINEILELGEARDEFPIHADVSGYVTIKNVNLGDHVTMGQTIYEIANLSTVWVQFDVYESDLPWVKVGKKVSFTVASIPGKTFKGTVSFVDPVLNRNSRTARARVEVRNTDLMLKPEMNVSGKIESDGQGGEDGIVIPKSAILWTGRRSLVYVKEESDSGLAFRLREVVLGNDLGSSYAIESGLSEGEEIAVNGTFSIDAAAQLAGKRSMMTSKTQEQSGSGGEADPQLIPLVNLYLDLKDRLVADDLTGAKLKAGELRDGFRTFVNKNDWAEFSNEILDALGETEQVGDIGEIRARFQTVSESMIAMVRKLQPMNESIYVQYCPMADNNQGAEWLSRSDEVLNPYFGASMLTCGETLEKIN